MTAIRADDLFHLYSTPHGEVAALRGLSLDIADGESVSVLGPSGSGKTTLLELCSGLARPSSGTLTVLDHPFDRSDRRELARVRRASIGIVRQHYHRALPRDLTVEEIVAFPLRLAGSAERGRASALIRAAGLEHRARARPDELSGGEQQRVAVCAALSKRPRLLLADEPTGELDAAATDALVELIAELAHASGTTVLVVTHDPRVAAAMGRTIHIRDGRFAAEGTAHPLLVVDEQGWVRLPRAIREEAGVGDRVRANARWGRVELVAEETTARAPAEPTPLEAVAKRAAAVAVAGVTKSHAPGAKPVLSNLTCTFAPERLHVVAGPSGSGKTTLLNLQAALDYPDSGEIWVGGERVDALAADEAARFRARTIGYVSQHSTLVGFLSARENVELALTLRGFEEEETRRRADRWLEWVGLADLGSRSAEQLSGGEQRRVALARALAPAPPLLLADEPTAHLDRLAGRMVIRLLQAAAHEGGTTVIAATHDPDVVAAADDRLVLQQP